MPKSDVEAAFHASEAPIANKVGFILLSNPQAPMPSTRIAVSNMLPFLRAAGFDPHVVEHRYEDTETPELVSLAPALRAARFGTVVFQKVHGPSAIALARELRAAGVRTIYLVCDIVAPGMAEATDATATVSDFLRSRYPEALQPRIFTVHDGIEHPGRRKTTYRDIRGSRVRPLKAILVTAAELDRLPVLISPPPWLHVTIMGRYPEPAWGLQRLRQDRWTLLAQRNARERLDYLRFLAHPRIRRVAWSAESVYAAMEDADIGIIPIETDPAKGALSRWEVRSENRLTMKMAVGLPVVATPIPSYEPVVKNGENAFLARSRDEWIASLEWLRDPVNRRTMGENARASVIERYSMEHQAERLVAVLRGGQGAQHHRP